MNDKITDRALAIYYIRTNLLNKVNNKFSVVTIKKISNNSIGLFIKVDGNIDWRKLYAFKFDKNFLKQIVIKPNVFKNIGKEYLNNRDKKIIQDNLIRFLSKDEKIRILIHNDCYKISIKYSDKIWTHMYKSKLESSGETSPSELWNSYLDKLNNLKPFEL